MWFQVKENHRNVSFQYGPCWILFQLNVFYNSSDVTMFPFTCSKASTYRFYLSSECWKNLMRWFPLATPNAATVLLLQRNSQTTTIKLRLWKNANKKVLSYYAGTIPLPVAKECEWYNHRMQSSHWQKII
jgi:hypothetical protein